MDSTNRHSESKKDIRRAQKDTWRVQKDLGEPIKTYRELKNIYGKTKLLLQHLV